MVIEAPARAAVEQLGAAGIGIPVFAGGAAAAGASLPANVHTPAGGLRRAAEQVATAVHGR